MPATVCVNGRFVEPDDAQVGVFDAGLQHAVGLFETMTAVTQEGQVGPRVIDLEAHLARLATSAETLGLTAEMRTDALAETVRQAVERAALPRARVRLTVTGGDLNLREDAIGTPHRPTVIVHAQPAAAYPEPLLEHGVRVTIAAARPSPLDPTASHKTLNYWWRLRELRAASAAKAAEALVFQVTNHLCGGCVSSALLVRDGRVITPLCRGEEPAGAPPSPVLPGVVRAAALERLGREGVDVETRPVTIDDVLDADELMLTNSGWGVMPVVAVEANEIGAGTPGEITRDLIAWWRDRTA